MDNYLMIDGEKIELSNETARNIRDGRKMEESLFEQQIDNIRVSATNDSTYLGRISILNDALRGAKMGEFPIMNWTNDLPGDVFTKDKAKLLAQAILDCIEAVENK